MPMKVKELIDLLEAKGWVQVRQRGSHRQYHHPSQPNPLNLSHNPPDQSGIVIECRS